MRQFKFKLILLLGFLLPTIWSSAMIIFSIDGYSNIVVKEANTHGSPKSSSIEATIDGHTLTIVFLENLGQVDIEVSLVDGGETQVESTPTPNGVIFYITDTGSYIVTFTLENGDEYYGEFDVTD